MGSTGDSAAKCSLWEQVVVGVVVGTIVALIVKGDK